MRTSGRKKKIDKQIPIETKDQNIIEPPKNLLPEKAEPEKEIVPVSKEEDKTVSEQKEVLPTVDVKTNEVKSEEVISASVSSPPSSSPPPISVPISQVEPLASVDKPSGKSFLWIVGVILFILLVVGGAWMFLSNNSKKGEKNITIQTSMKPTITKVEPTVISTEEAKLDKYPIKVLNGSGITGEASKLQEILEKGGFEVVETSNADNYDYVDTIVQAKKNVEKAFLEKLKNLIGKSYTLGKDESLSASDSSDVIVVVGSKKAGN
ncbi:hypothetical protein A3A46_00470 [Candidatus Roizmanbacteria bacterium RIFCSPLOWO2_01_FULL_37_13]|uniref:LytR/CpsA/Psr regulator C-terminal domain-containing protein n=1 Tax=Candidatus Roizmanbacteria bacterium RIFCSPHIGHO2_02_FULL_38_11 TaxID=1802039 RepID=A0A1F7GYK5_9BACT|nr:MAG: hypothetical protein A3C25_00230 [Candidatus Roizmanbacteria bacterium RIFCSPHIGHO2_02_FULL_38_11]OGK41732.1 MAG: hypothetical protein A3A46_00470 [Candidatus Roizmanbacteria bacterium RIFCSPLOWO2_01_FULL_37_13]